MEKPAVYTGPVTLVTCSGVSNTGKLTTQVAYALQRTGPRVFECHIPARTDSAIIRQEAADAGCICVLDGCGDCCALKKVEESGITPDIHIVTTEHGIAKNGMADVSYQEIELIFSIVKRKISRI